MAFAHQQKRSPESYVALRKNRHALLGRLNTTEFETVRNSLKSTSRCPTMVIFSSAALLWFESLSREQQSDRVADFEAAAQKSAREQCHVNPVRWIGIKFRTWNFPLSTQSDVLGALMIGFAELPDETRAEWVREVRVGAAGGGE